MEAIPYTVEARPDTGLNNVKIGIWLFLASEVMLFGALFAGYIILRVGSPEWPAGTEFGLSVPLASIAEDRNGFSSKSLSCLFQRKLFSSNDGLLYFSKFHR